MNIADTISVNPVSKTLGALHPEAAARFFNTNTSDAVKKAKSSRQTVSGILFASSTPSVNHFGATILLLRLLFSTILIVSGSLILSGEIFAPTEMINAEYLGLGEIIAGSMLALGFLSRVAMGISTGLFGYIAAMAIMSGVFDMQALLCCMGSLVFLVMGTGKYSCDFLLRKTIILQARRRQKRIREQRLSYRAYRIHNM